MKQWVHPGLYPADIHCIHSKILLAEYSWEHYYRQGIVSNTNIPQESIQ